MNILQENHQQILAALNKHKVVYMLVGGYAVIYYGYGRTTGDLDLWIEPSNTNKLLLLNALEDLEFEEVDIDILSQQDFTKAQVFSIGEEPFRTDFLTKVNLVSFDEAIKKSIRGTINEITVPVIHLDHLLLSKFNTGRIKDQADIEALQKISNTSK